MADFQIEIYTQEKQVFTGAIDSLVAPGEEGYLGVLAHHAPLLTTLGAGDLTLRHRGQVTQYRVSGGFLEVHANHATILADSLEEAG